jgi:hypothetical protein
VAIRIRKKQQGLFADGSTVKHFAVISNLWDWTPKKLLAWHREKAGTIEEVLRSGESSRYPPQPKN